MKRPSGTSSAAEARPGLSMYARFCEPSRYAGKIPRNTRCDDFSSVCSCLGALVRYSSDMAGNRDETAEMIRLLETAVEIVEEGMKTVDAPEFDKKAKAAVSAVKACQAIRQLRPGPAATEGRDGGLDAAGEQRLREELLGRTRAWRCRGSPERERMATSGMASRH